MKKPICILITIFLMLALVGCSSQHDNYSRISGSISPITLERAVEISSFAIVGIYGGIEYHNEYVYYLFTIEDTIYGQAPSDNLKMYALRTDEDMGNRYIEGEKYILLLEIREKTIWEREHIYLSPISDMMMPISGPYYTYGRRVTFPEGQSFIDYLRMLGEELADKKEPFEIVRTYDSIEEEIVDKSKFIAYVVIDRLDMEGVEYTNTYRCTVDELIKGHTINTLTEGSILMVITKGAVDIGGRYLIGFNPVDENSVIYWQSTIRSVISVTDMNTLEKLFALC